MGGSRTKVELDHANEMNLSSYNQKTFTVPKDGIVSVLAGWQPNSYAYVRANESMHRYLSASSTTGANGYSETVATAPVWEGMVLYVEIGSNSQAWFTPFK